MKKLKSVLLGVLFGMVLIIEINLCVDLIVNYTTGTNIVNNTAYVK